MPHPYKTLLLVGLCATLHPAHGADSCAQAAKTSAIASAPAVKYTQVANNGTELPAAAAPGSAASDWACTRDNASGLTWEVKTSAGLRSRDHTYTWNSGKGQPGDAIGADTCDGTLAAYGQQCNTAHYVAAVNAAGLCGHKDWRLPTLQELQSLADFSTPHEPGEPAIDAAYFPNTQMKWTWSATPFAGQTSGAWGVRFQYGFPYADAKTYANAVRLVRGQ